MSDWTDKKIDKLKKLWEKGFSAAEIGKKLGFSKNAVVGKVHRLGISTRPSPIKPAVPAASKKDILPSAKSVPPAVQRPKKESSKLHSTLGKFDLFPILSDTKYDSPRSSRSAGGPKQPPVGVSMLDLTADMCCWPIDDANSDTSRFCGKKVFKNKPYCLEHCAMAYTNSAAPVEEREDEGAFDPPAD